MRSYYVAIFLAVAVLLSLAGTSQWACAQAHNAVFSGIQVTQKTYYGDNISISVTAKNNAVGLYPSLYFTCSLDGSYWFTSSEQSVVLFTTYTWSYVASGISPGSHTLVFTLYWDNSGTSVEEDVSGAYSSFVAYVHVSGWSQQPQPLTVQRGQSTPSSLLISFTNGGNDVMYSTSLSVQNSQGLAISPSSQGVGNIAAGGTSTVGFSVSAPASLNPGTYYPSFVVSYYDFEGGYHTETESATVSVIALTTSLNLAVPGSAKIGDSVAFSARLTDGNGNPVAGQSISFSIDGSSIGTALTDGTGTASITYSVSGPAGTYSILASFSGTASLGGSSASGTMVVNPLYLTLYSLVPNAQLFTVNGTYYSTDASGKALIPITAVGTYDVEVISPYETAAGTRVVFVQWADGLTTSSRSVVMNSDQSYTVTTKTQYLLALTAPGDATAMGQGWYDAGTNANFSISYSWDSSSAQRSNLLTYSLNGGANTAVPRSGSGSFNFTLTMSSPQQVSFSSVTQYYLSVSGGNDVTYGTPSPTNDGWYDGGMSTTVSSDYVWGGTPSQNQLRLLSWTLDDSPQSAIPIQESGAYTTSSILMDAAHSLDFASIEQFYLSVTSSWGTAQGEGWYDTGGPASFSVSPTTVPGTTGTQYVFLSWAGTGAASYSGSTAATSVSMTSQVSEAATWKTQYYLNVTSVFGTTSGSGWYDQGASAAFSVSPTSTSAGFLTYHVFKGWSGGSSNTSSSASISMGAPKTVVAVWAVDSTQLYLAVAGIAIAIVAVLGIILVRQRRKPSPSQASQAPVAPAPPSSPST